MAILPMSWKAAEANGVDVLRRHPELLGDRDRDSLDAEGMAGRVRVFGLHGRVEALDRLQ
jgi:hypothetical protein